MDVWGTPQRCDWLLHPLARPLLTGELSQRCRHSLPTQFWMEEMKGDQKRRAKVYVCVLPLKQQTAVIAFFCPPSFNKEIQHRYQHLLSITSTTPTPLQTECRHGSHYGLPPSFSLSLSLENTVEKRLYPESILFFVLRFPSFPSLGSGWGKWRV